MPLLARAASNPMARVSRLEKVVSLDTVIISSVLTRGLSSAASEVTLILIAHFSNVADQFVRWCSATTVLLVCNLAPVGIYFVSANAQTRLPVAWNFPWLMVALAVSFAVKTNPMFSILGDRRHMSRVAHTHFWQGIRRKFAGLDIAPPALWPPYSSQDNQRPSSRGNWLEVFTPWPLASPRSVGKEVWPMNRTPSLICPIGTNIFSRCTARNSFSCRYGRRTAASVKCMLSKFTLKNSALKLCCVYE